jgi:hypothetical protein
MLIDKDNARSRRTAQWTPDIVVGIDFGSVGTAVAFSNAPYWPEAELITSWPGRGGDVLATKVPSRISYHKNDPNRVKSWGFYCDYDNEDEEVKKNFKAALDPEHYGQDPDYPSLRAACRYTVDFLRCIYEHICSHLASFSLESPDRKVEFLFSVPSSWAKSRMQDRYRALIATAGFTKQPQHRINIETSEAEATAFSAVPRDAKTGAAVLVCHTGALFTELALLQTVTSRDAGHAYKTKAWTKAKAIGSARIDYKVHDLIKESLSSTTQGNTITSDSLPRKMMLGRYRTYKHAFGSDEIQWFSTLELPVPNAHNDMEDHKTSEVSRDEFSMEENDFRALLGQQLDKLTAFIEQELNAAQDLLPGQDIVLVMSGGFSDNPYLRKRFEIWTSITKSFRRSYNVSITFTNDGKLQVVQGLIMQRITTKTLDHHRLSPLGYDREIWGAIIRKFENINSTNTFSQVEDALNQDMPKLTSQFRMLQALYKAAYPMLSLEERAYVDKAFKDTDRSVRKIYAAPELDWMNSAISLSQHRTKQSNAAENRELPRLVHVTLQVLQHLGVVAEFLQEVLETRTTSGSTAKEYPEKNGLEKGKAFSELGTDSRSSVTLQDAEWLSLGTSRTSSIVTTRTKLSVTTTLEEDQRSVDQRSVDQHSVDLNFGGIPFHITHDGSSITSGDDIEHAPPPYSPTVM